LYCGARTLTKKAKRALESTIGAPPRAMARRTGWHRDSASWSKMPIRCLRDLPYFPATLYH
jgi:hypothetical protein